MSRWQHPAVVLGRLNAPKDKVAFLKTPGMNPIAMIAMHGLLVACNTHSSPETVLLEKHIIVSPVLIMCYVIVESTRGDP